MRVIRTAFIVAIVVSLVACGGATKPTSTPAAIGTGTVLLPGTTTPPPDPTRISPLIGTPDTTAPVATSSATRAAPPSVAATPTPLAATRATVPGPTAARAAETTPSVAAKTTAATPTTAAATTARATDIPTSAPQQVIGTQQDGLVLLNVRSANHDGYTRLVFDLTKQDGSAAPVPRTRVWTQGGTVIVALSGVRDDEYGQSLGAGEVPIHLGSVNALYRIPVRDDASVAYGITIKQGATVTVTSTTAPARVIVDIGDK